MRIFASNFYQRINLFSLAFILAASSISFVSPFLFSNNAGAVPPFSYENMYADSLKVTNTSSLTIGVNTGCVAFHAEIIHNGLINDHVITVSQDNTKITVTPEEGQVFLGSTCTGASISELLFNDGALASANFSMKSSVVNDANSVKFVAYVPWDIYIAENTPTFKATPVVKVVDSIIPEITLLGGSPVIVEKGTTYTDAGATASDNYNGDLTGSIVTVNLVDINTPNTYIVTYNVKDSSDNPAIEVTRTVKVVDTINPVVVLVSPENGAVVNGASITQSWSTTDTDVDYFVYESYRDEELNDLRYTENYLTNSKTALNIANDTYWWRVKAVDKAGNVGDWSEVWQITVDNDKPEITITNPNILPEKSKTVTALANEEGTLLMSINEAGVTTCGDGILSFITYADTTFSSELDNGKSICYKAVDLAGNTTYSVSDVISGIDTTAPVIELASSVIKDNTVSPVFTVTDTVSAIEKTVTGWTASSENPTGAVISGANLSPMFTVTKDGKYKFTLTATDEAGNVSTRDFNFTYTTTVVKPVVASVIPVVEPVVPPVVVDLNPITAPAPEVAAVVATPTVFARSTQSGVLGEDTEADADINSSEGSTDVKSATDKKVDSVWNIIGLAWYWWLFILAALAGIWWFIIAPIRRNKEDKK